MESITHVPTRVAVHFSPKFMAVLDDHRCSLPDLPNRAENRWRRSLSHDQHRLRRRFVVIDPVRGERAWASVGAASWCSPFYGLFGNPAAVLRSMPRIDTEEAFKVQVEAMSDVAPLIPVDAGCVRKRLREVVAWAASKGLAPHPDFAAVEQLFGD